MRIIDTILNRRWLYHSIIWITSTLVVFLFLATESTTFQEKLIDTLSIIAPSIVISYFLFKLQDLAISKKKYILYFIIGISATISIGYIMGLISANIYHSDKSLETTQWIQNMAIVAFIVFVSRLAKKGIKSQLELKELQVVTLQMELHLLRTQLNPHFLFNTINNICGINQINSGKSTEMLINLAELLRFHLEFSSSNSIPIYKEIQLIKAFIELEKMRFRDNCIVQFLYSTTDNNIPIPPLLLLPFVENAFKHGTHSINHSPITIDLKVSAMSLDFEIKNKVFDNQNVPKTNIGHKNISKRLELIYPKKHVLDIHEENEKYTVNLNINLV